MGFLDKKKRIIDTYVTPYGRKKLSNSGLGISYVALTDLSALYLSESNSTVDSEFPGLILESKSSFKDLSSSRTLLCEESKLFSSPLFLKSRILVNASTNS